MTKTQKGNNFQRYIRDYMEGRGWLVRNFPSEAKVIRIPDPKNPKVMKMIFVSRKLDFWGADLVCRRFDAIIGKVKQLYIQASLDGHIEKRVEEFQKYFEHTMNSEELQIWIKTGRGEINIKRVIIFDGKASTEDVGKLIRKKFYAKEELK